MPSGRATPIRVSSGAWKLERDHEVVGPDHAAPAAAAPARDMDQAGRDAFDRGAEPEAELFEEIIRLRLHRFVPPPCIVFRLQIRHIR